MHVAKLSAFMPHNIRRYSFLLEDEWTPGAKVWPEGLSQSKISIIQSELKLITFWLVAHCFNHMHYCHYISVCKCMFLTSNA
jgi:hypothetical protein